MIFRVLRSSALGRVGGGGLDFVTSGDKGSVRFRRFGSSIFNAFTSSVGEFTVKAVFEVVLPSVVPSLGGVVCLSSSLFMGASVRRL